MKSNKKSKEFNFGFLDTHDEFLGFPLDEGQESQPSDSGSVGTSLNASTSSGVIRSGEENSDDQLSEDILNFEYSSEQESFDEELLKDIYHYCFVIENLSKQVPLENIKQIQKILEYIVKKSIKKSNEEIKQLNQEIQSILNGKTGIKRALLSLGLRQCISLLIREEIDFQDDLEAYTHFLEKLLPKITELNSYEFYHMAKHCGVVEIHEKNTGAIVAYYKAGHHQQQSSQFLYELYQYLAKKMELPSDVEPAFPPCQPFDVLLSEVKLKGNLKFSDDDVISFMVRHKKNFPSGTRRCEEKYYFSEVDPTENLKTKAWLSGGIMPAIPKLPKWEQRFTKHERASLHMLIKLCFILMLGGRDVKSDGLGGNVSEIFFDMEDYLNIKPNKTNLHIPYMVDINSVKISKEDLVEMRAFMAKINIGDVIEQFIKKWKYDDFYNQNEFPTEGVSEDNGGCVVDIKEDDRQEYADKKPKFSDNCILSESQITNFKVYFGRLIKALDTMIEEYESRDKMNETTVFHFIELFDPEWAKFELQLRKAFDEVLSGPKSNTSNGQSKEWSSLLHSVESYIRSKLPPSAVNGHCDRRPLPSVDLTAEERATFAKTPIPTPPVTVLLANSIFTQESKKSDPKKELSTDLDNSTSSKSPSFTKD